MKQINELIKEIKEDKVDNLSTTSFKFKRDLWEFFQACQDKVAVEFGTHKGQTTRILSHLFKKVYTVNINNNDSARELNRDLNNIIYIDNFDLYTNQKLQILDDVSMFLIDAGHSYHQVISDINRAFATNCTEDCYIVFDDYGMSHYELEVKKAVDEAIAMGTINVVDRIGHDKGFNFGGTPPRILIESEGLITKIIWR